jgi:hypothetical protein
MDNKQSNSTAMRLLLQAQQHLSSSLYLANIGEDDQARLHHNAATAFAREAANAGGRTKRVR